MSDFNQTIKWLREGKKVRRAKWKFSYEYHLYDDGYRISGKVLLDAKNEDFFEVKCGSFKIEDFEATDWEIYCKKHEWVSAKIWTGKDYCEFKCKNCGIKKPEESELKTLKDLKEQDWSTHEGDKELVNAIFFDLKQLTIKRIKEKFMGSSTHGNCCTCTDCKNNHDDCKCDIIKEFKEFLDITEDDLK